MFKVCACVCAGVHVYMSTCGLEVRGQQLVSFCVTLSFSFGGSLT